MFRSVDIKKAFLTQIICKKPNSCPKLQCTYIFLFSFQLFPQENFPAHKFPVSYRKMCHTNLKKSFVPLDYLAFELTLLSFDSSGFEVMFSITSRIVYIAKYVQNMYKLVPVLGAVNVLCVQCKKKL